MSILAGASKSAFTTLPTAARAGTTQGLGER
jgi:hypothetical protein